MCIPGESPPIVSLMMDMNFTKNLQSIMNGKFLTTLGEMSLSCVRIATCDTQCMSSDYETVCLQGGLVQ